MPCVARIGEDDESTTTRHANPGRNRSASNEPTRSACSRPAYLALTITCRPQPFRHRDALFCSGDSSVGTSLAHPPSASPMRAALGDIDLRLDGRSNYQFRARTRWKGGGGGRVLLPWWRVSKLRITLSRERGLDVFTQTTRYPRRTREYGAS